MTAPDDPTDVRVPEEKRVNPPVFSWLPKYVAKTRIRTTTALLIAAFVLCGWAYLVLNDSLYRNPPRSAVPVGTTSTEAPRDYQAPTETTAERESFAAVSPRTAASAGAAVSGGAFRGAGESMTSGRRAAPSAPESSPTVPGRAAPGQPGASPDPVSGAPAPDRARTTTAAAP